LPGPPGGEGTGGVILCRTQSPDGEETDKSEFEGFKWVSAQRIADG
jgi:hypothetical protein